MLCHVCLGRRERMGVATVIASFRNVLVHPSHFEGDNHYI